MNKQPLNIDEDNQFSLSTGDLMAALLLIFVLLLIGTMLKLQEEFDNKSDVAEKYKELKGELYLDLNKEFKDSLSAWQAEIDSTTLTIRFKEPDVLFENGEFELKKSFKGILKYFFPRYINVLSNDKYINHIEEIRIEGHTSSEGKEGESIEEAYFSNMKLSQNRTLSVLKFCLSQIDKNKLEWTKDRTTANGLSSVKPIANNSTVIGRRQNRRVEFRIKTDAEKQIIKMLDYAPDK